MLMNRCRAFRRCSRKLASAMGQLLPAACFSWTYDRSSLVVEQGVDGMAEYQNQIRSNAARLTYRLIRQSSNQTKSEYRLDTAPAPRF